MANDKLIRQKQPSMPTPVWMAMIMLFLLGAVFACLVTNITINSVLSPINERDFRIAICSIPILIVILVLWFETFAFLWVGESLARIALALWFLLPALVSFLYGVKGPVLPLIVIGGIPLVLLALPQSNRWFREKMTYRDVDDTTKYMNRIKAEFPGFETKSVEEQLAILERARGSIKPEHDAQKKFRVSFGSAIVVCLLFAFIKHMLIPSTSNIRHTTNDKEQPKDQVIHDSDLLDIPQEISKDAVPNKAEWSVVRQQGKVEFMIPPTMEVRDGKYAQLAKTFSSNKGIPYNEQQIVIQQKGLNSLDVDASNTYLRVIYTCQIDKKGKYCSRGEKNRKSGFREEQLLALGEELKYGTEHNIKMQGRRLHGQSKILKWGNVEIVCFGEYCAAKLSYLRQYDSNPPVSVIVYQICDDDRLHTILFSYRENDSSRWGEVCAAMKSTFKFIRQENP